MTIPRAPPAVHYYVCVGHAPTPIAHRHMNITARSSKAEIIDAALELTDSQAERIAQLEQRQTVLWTVCGLLTLALLVG